MKKIVVRILIFIIAIAIPLVVAEIYLRIYNPQITLEKAYRAVGTD